MRLGHFVVGRGRHAVHAPGDGAGGDFLLIFIGAVVVPQLAGRGPDDACLVLNVAHPSVPFSGVQQSPESQSQLESESALHSSFVNGISLVGSATLSIMEFGGLLFEKLFNTAATDAPHWYRVSNASVLSIPYHLPVLWNPPIQSEQVGQSNLLVAEVLIFALPLGVEKAVSRLTPDEVGDQRPRSGTEPIH